MADDSSRTYWDRVSGEKHFQHQLRIEWVRECVTGASILDCGCGYGRLLRELVHGGYPGAVGADFSAGMLARCAATYPELARLLVQADSRALPFRESRFDAVLAFTLLTSMPRDSDQYSLMREIRRILRPGGVSYLSDLLLNPDDRNLRRSGTSKGVPGLRDVSASRGCYPAAPQRGMDPEADGRLSPAAI